MAGATHDWSAPVDEGHLADIRARADELAPGGTLHLVLEVLAYAAEEAQARGGGHARVTLHDDGSVSVADDGRGTQTEVRDGRPVRKPVMATRDLRFFADPAPPLLPDGAPRRGASVAAALCTRLVHLNRRAEGSWSQLYEHGVPADELVGVEPDGSTGTTVRLWPQPGLAPLGDTAPLRGPWPDLQVEVVDERGR